MKGRVASHIKSRILLSKPGSSKIWTARRIGGLRRLIRRPSPISTRTTRQLRNRRRRKFSTLRSSWTIGRYSPRFFRVRSLGMQLTKNTNSKPCNLRMVMASKMSHSGERRITRLRRKEWEINSKDTQRTRICPAQRWAPTESLRMVHYGARPWLFRRVGEQMRQRLPRGP